MIRSSSQYSKACQQDGIIFLVSDFTIGGIQTFIANMATTLSDDGVRVTILCLKRQIDSFLMEKLGRKVELRFFSEFDDFRFGSSSVGWAVVAPKNISLKALICSHEQIHVTDSATLMFWASLSLNFNTCPRLTVSMYHSEEFIWSSTHTFRRLEQKTFASLDDNALVFVNSTCKEKCKQRYQRLYTNSNLVPVGVPQLSRQLPAKRERHTNFGVYIGRLVGSKCYLDGFIKSIPIILEKYPDFEFHIFGEGPEKRRLMDLAFGMPVKFFNQVQYSELLVVYERYGFALGSGTSILHSASCGVPSIVGIESMPEPLTYGLLEDTVGPDYMEQGLSYELVPFDVVVDKILGCDEETYLNYSQSARVRAADFSMEQSAGKLFGLGQKVESNFKAAHKVAYYLSYVLWSLKSKIGIGTKKADRHKL